MATDRTDAPLDQYPAATDEERPEAPGIDHLTVVPENADTER